MEFLKYGLKIFISRIEVKKMPIYVGGRWGHLPEKLSLFFPRNLWNVLSCINQYSNSSILSKDFRTRILMIIDKKEYFLFPFFSVRFNLFSFHVYFLDISMGTPVANIFACFHNFSERAFHLLCDIFLQQQHLKKK